MSCNVQGNVWLCYAKSSSVFVLCAHVCHSVMVVLVQGAACGHLPSACSGHYVIMFSNTNFRYLIKIYKGKCQG